MKCVIFNCDSILPKFHRKDTCYKCRNCFAYWEKPNRGVAAVLMRQKQLSKWQSRMGYLATIKSPQRFKRAKDIGFAAHTAVPTTVKEGATNGNQSTTKRR